MVQFGSVTLPLNHNHCYIITRLSVTQLKCSLLTDSIQHCNDQSWSVAIVIYLVTNHWKCTHLKLKYVPCDSAVLWTLLCLSWGEVTNSEQCTMVTSLGHQLPPGAGHGHMALPSGEGRPSVEKKGEASLLWNSNKVRGSWCHGHRGDLNLKTPSPPEGPECRQCGNGNDTWCDVWPCDTGLSW